MKTLDSGNQIKKLMKKHEMNEKQLANKMNIDIKTLRKKLSGEQDFYTTEIIAITNIFELKLEQCAEIFFNAK